MTTKGALIAAMAAGLLGAATPLVAAAADSDQVRCQGVNACKGKSACKTASNGCAGQNACKGKGFTEATKADCDKAGGKFEENKG